MLFDKELVYPASASACALIGAGFDIKHRRIPNLVTGPGLLAGVSLHLWLDGWHGVLASLAGGTACGVLFLMFYLAGGMGAGDVKLMTAAGCLAGVAHAPYLLLLTSLAGGVMGLLLASWRGRLRTVLLNVLTLASHHRQQGLRAHPDLNVRNSNHLRLPYGLAIAAGSCLTLYLQGAPR